MYERAHAHTHTHTHLCTERNTHLLRGVVNRTQPTPSFSSPFLTCCAILPTSFVGNGPHLRQWLVTQHLHWLISQLRFSRVFLNCNVNARRSMHSSRDATLGASGLWLGTQTGAGGTTTLAKSFFWPQPIASWTTGLLRGHKDIRDHSQLLASHSFTKRQK